MRTQEADRKGAGEMIPAKQSSTRSQSGSRSLGCPIGAAIARLVARRPQLRLVAAIDADPAKVGRDAGAVIGLDELTGFPVLADFAEAVQHQPTVVLHATGSSLRAVAPQLMTVARSGARLISTCEELAFPFPLQVDTANELDQFAKEHGTVILGTGVNPGFVMDALPCFVTGVCASVRSVHVERVVDTALRRQQLQVKTGAGLTVDEFKRLATDGRVRHIGLAESAQAIAQALGWRLTEFTDSIEPVVAKRDLESKYLRVKPGSVAGVHQVVVGHVDGHERVRLELTMALNVEEPRDEIRIEGNLPIRLVIPNGVFGDTATAAIVVNAIPRVRGARAGLLTMLDFLPAVSVGEVARAGAA